MAIRIPGIHHISPTANPAGAAAVPWIREAPARVTARWRHVRIQTQRRTGEQLLSNSRLVTRPAINRCF